MSRALKIISPRQHLERGLSAESASGRISKKISPPSSNTWTVREAHFDLSPPFGVGSERRGARGGQTRREEKIALETINKLMVSISHYLNNPLTVLLGRVELLCEANENGGILKDEIRKFAESCKREIHKIESIIKVFQNLCEVRYRTYPPGIKMLDVEKEIKDRLKEVEAFNTIGTKRGQ